MTIYAYIQLLLNEGMKRGMIEPMDEIYVRNRLLALLQLDEFKDTENLENYRNQLPDDPEIVIPYIIDQIVQYACERGIIEDYFDIREIFSAKIMDCFLPHPSTVNRIFFEKLKRSPREATDYFYAISKNSNYIQMSRIKKNIVYQVETEYGELDITINLSKPEKDPKQIALEKSLKKKAGYPKCALCIENEGYAGRIGFAARSNHRMIRIPLRGETWYLQYSPYSYYNEHCIVLSEEHRNMEISRETYQRLLDFVELFPHYFLGSNADLPIVGGSILTHDHYQGGRYEFAMARAADEYIFSLERFPDVKFSVLKWPMSVIRLRSVEKDSLVAAADWISSNWRGYRDEEVNIIPYTGDTPHNTVTPIARKKGNHFELDIVLRNNRTSDEHPLGIFHPHEDVHHIKKENIGLIEVMGLAVLPGRLKEELKEVEKYLLQQPNHIAEYHRPWAEELLFKYKEIVNVNNVTSIIRKEVGKKFLRVLEDAGVFKRDEQGQEAFKRFIKSLQY
mgnify:FL=1